MAVVVLGLWVLWFLGDEGVVVSFRARSRSSTLGFGCLDVSTHLMIMMMGGGSRSGG